MLTSSIEKYQLTHLIYNSITTFQKQNLSNQISKGRNLCGIEINKRKGVQRISTMKSVMKIQEVLVVVLLILIAQSSGFNIILILILLEI